jgi:hypothetical protein
MEILWLAIVFYSLGLAGILHIRPRLMFHENGSWKEFGYQRDSRHTMFPFWLFAIAWAFVSYALAAAFTWSYGSTAMATAAAVYSSPPSMNYIPDESEEELPRRRRTPKSEPRAGYYVLDPASEESGIHRYIYYGNRSPALTQEE